MKPVKPCSPINPWIPWAPVKPVEPDGPATPLSPVRPWIPWSPVGPAGPVTSWLYVTVSGLTPGGATKSIKTGWPVIPVGFWIVITIGAAPPNWPPVMVVPVRPTVVVGTEPPSDTTRASAVVSKPCILTFSVL